MANLDGFDAREHEPTGGPDALPAGEYLAMATDSEMKSTKSGNGKYLQIAWKVLDGPHEGRMLWSRLNLENPNQTAVDIAKRELSAICHAVGVLRPKRSEELHGVPVMLRVGVRKRPDTGDLSNEVKGYKPASGSKPEKPITKKSEDSPPWA